MFALFNQYDQPVTVTIQLLKQLNIKVTDATVNETISNHPDYPSVLSISDALSTWHLENAAIKIKPDTLTELPVPFIAFIKSNGNSSVLITSIKNDNVFYLDANNKTKTKKLSEFQQQFPGVVLLAETNEKSGQADFKKAKQKQRIQQLRIPAFITVGLLLVAADIINSPIINKSFATVFSFLLILKFTGALVTVLLLWFDVDKANPALQKVCNGGGKTNCDVILNSRAAKIFGLSWSEIGFFYFAGGFLILLISLNNQGDSLSTFQLIHFFNLLTLPYVFFSVFYQWRIAKQWCPLCLTVQAILVLEFIAVISFGKLKFTLPSQLINPSTFPIAFMLPIITWFIIKPLLYNMQKMKQDFRSLQRIKFNTDVFNLLLGKQKRLTVPADGIGICLGSYNAANTLIKVCNPYCGPCAKAHPGVEKLLEENSNLKAQIIFTATNNENNSLAVPVKHLVAIAEQGNETLTKNALNDWYLAEKKDYNVFAEKYPMNGELKIQGEKLDAMKKWCDKVEISFTPTFFYNGYQLPDAYSISDLKYFLAE